VIDTTGGWLEGSILTKYLPAMQLNGLCKNRVVIDDRRFRIQCTFRTGRMGWSAELARDLGGWKRQIYELAALDQIEMCEANLAKVPICFRKTVEYSTMASWSRATVITSMETIGP
jgi:hypothetical protein